MSAPMTDCRMRRFSAGTTDGTVEQVPGNCSILFQTPIATPSTQTDGSRRRS